MQTPMCFRFDGFEVDPRSRQLRKHGLRIKLHGQPFQILLMLLERPGEVVTRDEIRQKLWSADTFVDFEHSLNTAIQKLRETLDDSAETPRYIETLPRLGYCFIAPAECKSSPIPAPNRVMLVVLPFENLSDDPAQEYFSDGLTEETITNLGQVASGQMGVIARTSAMAYKRTRKSIAEIGRELGVNYAVEGTVRRDGRRVRISAQLIRASDQTHLWAQSYDRDLKDFLEVQAELGRSIAEQVQVRLMPADRPKGSAAPEINQAAYDAYLHGRFHLWKVTRPNVERAIEYFSKAMRADPHMAAAYAGLADAYSILPITSDELPRESFPKAEHAAMQALKIDPGCAEAHAALASIRYWYSWNWAASEDHARRAIARNPSYARAYVRLAHMHSNTGRHAEAIPEIDRGCALDPLSPITKTMGATFRFQARQFDAVAPALQKVLELDPNFWVAHIVFTKLYLHEGRYEEALASAMKARESSAGNTEAISLIGQTYGVMGRRDEAEKILAELQALSARKFVPPYNFATVYIGLGEMQAALDWLEKAYNVRDVHMIFLGVEPKWDPLRSHPRFESLLRRVGLAQ
jgi:TolB-like protein/Flp pilus assembly protein TadD